MDKYANLSDGQPRAKTIDSKKRQALNSSAVLAHLHRGDLLNSTAPLNVMHEPLSEAANSASKVGESWKNLAPHAYYNLPVDNPSDARRRKDQARSFLNLTLQQLIQQQKARGSTQQKLLNKTLENYYGANESLGAMLSNFMGGCVAQRVPTGARAKLASTMKA